MSGLAEVLAAHEQRHRPQTGDSVCSCGEWVGPMTTLPWGDPRAHRKHVADAILAHLRTVAADEGARNAVALALLHTPEWDDPPRGFPVVRSGCAERAAEAAIKALLDHLGGGRASDGEVGR